MHQVQKLFQNHIFLIILIGIFLFVIGNNNFTLFDNSETNYSAVAKGIVNTGDYLTMHYNGENWYIHPPLYFWLSSSLCKAFGWNEFNLRLPEAVFGILGLIALYLIARLYYSKKTAFYSAIIIGTSLSYFVISRLAIFDTLLNAFILFAIYFFLKSYLNPEKKGKYFFFFAISCFLGVMTKGPIGLVHPCAVIVIFLLIKKDLKFLFDKKVLLNFLFFLIITSPWYIHQLIVNGAPFFDKALRDYTWFRFFGVVESQSGPWWYYFPMLLTFIPWIFYLPVIIKDAFTKNNKQSTEDIKLFSWVFIIFTFIFFSFAGTKLPSYILSMFPFMAILIADQLVSFKFKKTIIISTCLTYIFFVLLFLISLIYKLPFPYTPEMPLFITFFLIPMLIVAIFSYFLIKGKTSKAMISITGGTIIFCLFLAYFFFPAIDKYKESKLFIDTIQTQNIPDYTVGVYNHYTPYLIYYLNKKIHTPDSLEEIDNLLQEEKPLFLMVRHTDIPEILHQFKRLKILKTYYEFSALLIYI
ncbi:MAG: glycosyltransferase family 39 protein [Candidatus Riflemargulisbacteria bacterium]